MTNNGGFFKRTVRDIPLYGKTILLRADYNVPLGDDGSISDDFRIRASVPTLEYLLSQDCKIVICSHLGRPDGKKNKVFSLEPVAERVSELLNHPVGFLDQTVGDPVKQHVKTMGNREVLLLENVRFYPGEEANDAEFARQLATSVGADFFVQDGFGVVHRAHASTDAITQFIPSVAGLLLEREVTVIRAAINEPQKPLVALLGGAKVSDKIGVIERLVDVADTIVIGGAMANTFLKERGYPVGVSKREDGLGNIISQIYRAAEKKVGSKTLDNFLVLPTDVVVAKSPTESTVRTVVNADDVADDDMILDVGTKSIERAAAIVSRASTIIWNGTFGYAETEVFSHGSARMALAIAANQESTSVVGGGDTADFVLKWSDGTGDGFTHISTGGGASLELMAGQPMPGIDALLDA